MRKTLVRRLRRHESADRSSKNKYLHRVDELVSKAFDRHDQRTYHVPAFGYTLENRFDGGRVLRCHGVDILATAKAGWPEPVELDFYQASDELYLYVTEQGDELQLNATTVQYITTCRDAVADMVRTLTTREGEDE